MYNVATKNTSSATKDRKKLSNIYTGFHAVEERIRRAKANSSSDITINIFYSKAGPRIKKIISLAKECSINCQEVKDSRLDDMVKSLPVQARDHRGIVLVAEGEKARQSNIVLLDQWLSFVPENATVVILDSVTDPHNVGAVLRSCDQFGAGLLIVPERRSASDISANDIIARSSAGASAWVPVCTVTNLVRSVELLKEKGFWIYGADAGGESLQKCSFAQKTCLVMGSEGSGIAKLLAQQCDCIVSIPTCGKIDSLNVSVAAGVLLYERYRQSLS